MMNLMAKQEIQKLLSQTEHTLTVDDFSLLSDLNKAAERVTDPTGDKGKFPRIPIRLCGLLLVAPTISITQWYNECAMSWWGDSSYSDLAMGYVLQSHITGDWLWEQDRKTLEKEMRKFARKLQCTPSEYEDALKQVLGIEGDIGDAGDEDEGNFGPLISLLCKEYSGTPEYWLHSADMDTISALVDTYLEGIEAEYKQIKKQTKGASLPPFKTPKMAALEDFRKQSRIVEEAWQRS
jgi:hypothetical protein